MWVLRGISLVLATAPGQDIAVSSGNAELILLDGTREATAIGAGEVTSPGCGRLLGIGRPLPLAKKIHHNIKIRKIQNCRKI